MVNQIVGAVGKLVEALSDIYKVTGQDMEGLNSG